MKPLFVDTSAFIALTHAKDTPISNYEPTEIAIVSQDDTARFDGLCKHVAIAVTAQAVVQHRHDILPQRRQRPHHIGVNVLVDEQREIEGIHAEICTSHTISFFSALAA